MSINTEGLEAFKDKRPAPRKKAEWAPAGLDPLPDGKVLAFDPSLSSTGVVALKNWFGTCEVLWAYTYKTSDNGEGAGGHTANLRRAMELTRLFRDLFTLDGGPDWVVVHEAPPTGGGTIQRPESALMACQALWTAASDLELTIAPMIRPQDHKRFTCGQPNATKKDHHAALMTWAEGLGITNLGVVRNEHTRDALSIALTHLGRR